LEETTTVALHIRATNYPHNDCLTGRKMTQ